MLTAAVTDDLRSLSQQGLLLIQALAVLNGRSDPQMHIAVAGLGGVPELAEASEQAASPDEQYRRAWQELQDRGLLAGPGHEDLHPVVRFSVYRAADPGWRREAHRRAALQMSAETLDRAKHLACLGEDLRAEEAQNLVDAAALIVGSEPQTALTWLQQVPAAHRDQQGQMLLARAEMLNGELNQAAHRLGDMLAAHDSSAVRILLANVLRIQGEWEEARAVLSADWEIDDAALLREAIDVHGLLDGRAPEHLVKRLARLPGVENQMATATYTTMDLLSTGEVAQARAGFTRVMPELLRADQQTLRGMLHTVACAVWCAFMLEDYAGGAQLGSRGLKIAQRFGQADVLANLGTGLSFNLVQLAQIPEAEAAGKQAIHDAQRFGPTGVDAMAQAGLLIAAQAQPDQQLLEQRYRQLRETQLPRFGWWRRAVLTTLTRVSALLGEPEVCLELLGEPRDVMAPLRFADSALVAARSGRVEEAFSLIQEGRQIATAHGSAGQSAMLEVTTAEILLGGGELTASREHFLAAQTEFQRLGMALQLGRVRAGLARLDAEVQVQTQAQAEAQAQARAETPDHTQQSDPLQGLTRREREVAQLVGVGLTSREIAEKLVISPRTAEHHTAKIMRKLGVSSRVAVMALIQGGAA